jgi:hypothetical protein
VVLSSDYCTLKLGQMKEYNTQVQYDTWGMDIGLLNHVKNKFVYSLPLSLFFKYFNYIVGYCVNLK